MLMMSIAALVLAGLPAGASAVPQEESSAAGGAAAAQGVFAPGEHFVAYRTVKGMFFFFDATVVGRNCAIDAKLEAQGPDYRLVMTIPVTSFDSGNDSRDEHVAELLGGPARRALEFESEALPAEALASLLRGNSGSVAGNLFIDGTPHAVTFALQPIDQDGQVYLTAYTRTAFSVLGVTVPKVGPGGLIARPGDALDLLAQLDLAKLVPAEVLDSLTQVRAAQDELQVTVDRQ
jgi:polyisoprenoid-binding protein YceI